jgi:hypothetical protein
MERDVTSFRNQDNLPTCIFYLITFDKNSVYWYMHIMLKTLYYKICTYWYGSTQILTTCEYGVYEEIICVTSLSIQENLNEINGL